MKTARPTLAALCAFAAVAFSAHGANSGEVGDTAGVATLENTPVASAPTPSVAAALADVQPSASQRAPQRGNPLWAIPLRSLDATRNRPLFSASRRPPPTAITATPAPAPAAPAPVVARAAEPERPPMNLIGTIVSASGSIAIVVDDATRSAKRLHEGDEESGWRVKTVLDRSAIVEKGDQSVTLALPKASDQPAPGAADMPAEAPPPVNDGAL